MRRQKRYYYKEDIYTHRGVGIARRDDGEKRDCRLGRDCKDRKHGNEKIGRREKAYHTERSDCIAFVER